MVIRGEQGDTGGTGDTGRTGNVGMGLTGKPGPVGPRGMSGTAVGDRRLMFVMAWGLLAFLFLAGLGLWNQYRLSSALHRVDDNTRSIQMLVYDQCRERNVTTARQNGLIDRAIEAEKRRTKPNPQTIRDLIAFKGTIARCGTPPD